MKKIINIVAICAVIFASCKDELAIPVSADFTTNIVNNKLEAGKSFTVYLYSTSGEFLTYFKGSSPDSTFNEDNLINKGFPVEDRDLDSVVVPGYELPTGIVDTLYKFTMLATTYDYENDEVVSDSKSIMINVFKPEAEE